MSVSSELNMEYRLLVIELDDVVPRRNPEKPNLYVSKTAVEPIVRFEFLQRSTQANWYNGHVIKMRPDLTPNLVFADEETANNARKTLRADLLADGYTVNRNQQIWHVYVLELTRESMKYPEKKRHVYVGQTSHTPHDRLLQHLEQTFSKSGKSLATSATRGKTVGLLSELAPTEIFYSEQASKIAEAELAAHFRNIGYEVKGGH